MKRLVETNRWQDSFFIGLHPNAKILLSFLYDTCNESGFIDVHYSVFSAQLNMPKEFIVTSLKALQSKLLSDKKKKLFIKDFLKHQNKLPLIRGNEEHDSIINKLESNLERFDNHKSITDILKNVKELTPKVEEKPKKERVKKEQFVAPEFEELKEYYLSQKPDAELSAIQDIYDHYKSVGWKTNGGVPLKDWQSAVRKAIRNRDKFAKNGRNYSSNNGEKKETKMDNIVKENDKIKDFDYSTLKK